MQWEKLSPNFPPTAPPKFPQKWRFLEAEEKAKVVDWQGFEGRRGTERKGKATDLSREKGDVEKGVRLSGDYHRQTGRTVGARRL